MVEIIGAQSIHGYTEGTCSLSDGLIKGKCHFRDAYIFYELFQSFSVSISLLKMYNM